MVIDNNELDSIKKINFFRIMIHKFYTFFTCKNKMKF